MDKEKQIKEAAKRSLSEVLPTQNPCNKKKKSEPEIIDFIDDDDGGGGGGGKLPYCTLWQ